MPVQNLYAMYNAAIKRRKQNTMRVKGINYSSRDRYSDVADDYHNNDDGNISVANLFTWSMLL